MELNIVEGHDEVVFTEPESEEVDENFYMNRLLMLGTEGALPSSPHSNPGLSYDNVISPQIEVLPRIVPKTSLANQQVDESLLVNSARVDAVDKDDGNSANVDHLSETAAPGETTQKRQRSKVASLKNVVSLNTAAPKKRTQKRQRTKVASHKSVDSLNVNNGQNAIPFKRLLRSSCKPLPQKSIENQQIGRPESKVTKETQKKSKNTSSKKRVHSSRGGQQRPGEKHYNSPGSHIIAIKKPRTDESLSCIHRRNRFGETLLHIAVLKGDVQSVEDIIKVGTCVNLTDNAGWTPLHEAVLHNHFTIVETLLKAEAHVDPAGYNGITPLQDAVLLGNLEITDLLLKHGADPLLKNRRGEAAVDINEDISVQNLLRKYLPVTKTNCLSDQTVSIAESHEESGIEKPGRRPCREARQSTEKDEATTSQQTSKTKVSVGPEDGGEAEKVHNSSTDGESSSKVTSKQEEQAKDMVIAGSILGQDVSPRVQDLKGLLPDTSSTLGSDSESDVTVDYIETNSSSPGHWFLSATQDFSGSLHRLFGELARRDANTIDKGQHASQSLVSTANKSNPSQFNALQREITIDGASKRALDGSRDDQESGARKKNRQISVANKNEAFLDYLLNFDLNSVCVGNSEGVSIARRRSDGSSSYASPKHSSICKNQLTYPAVTDADSCASQTQIDSPVECSVSLLTPCINDTSVIPIVKGQSVGVDTTRQPLKTLMLSPLLSAGTNLESTDLGSPSLLIGTCRIHDQGLTCSPEPQVKPNVLEQLKVTDEPLNIICSESSRTSSKSVTVTAQKCFDRGNQNQRASPLLNRASASITMDGTSELTQTNIDSVNCLPSKEVLSSSEETIAPSLLSYGNLLHSKSDKLDTPTIQVQQRDDNRDSQLSCCQASSSPTETGGIVSKKKQKQNGGQSGLMLVETTSETENRNTATPDVIASELLSPFALAKGDSTDVENDSSSVSADSDCTVIEEPEHIKTSNKDFEDVVYQLNQNNVYVAIICDKEQHSEQHGLYKAPDEQGIGEQLENSADPLDTGTSVSILRDLAQKPLCLLPTVDNNQESSASVKEHNLQIVVENEEVSFTDKLISQHQKKTGVSTTDLWKNSSKSKLSKHTNHVDAGTDQPVKSIQKMSHHRTLVSETCLHQACNKGDPPLIKTCVNTGMNINIPDNAGWTPLHKTSAAVGHVDVVEQLLHAGADVKRTGPDDVTPRSKDSSNPLDNQGSDCLPHEHILQGCKTLPSALCTSGSSASCGERLLPLTLQEVEEKQKEMSTWSMNKPEDRDRFTVNLLEMQTMLNNVFLKQHAEKIHLSKECKRTPCDGQLSQILLDLASRQKHLLMLLQKQNELKHKLKTSKDQHCSSLNTVTEISALNDLQHSQLSTDQNEENKFVCEHNYSTTIHSHMESQSVISNLDCPSLILESPGTPDDTRILSGLIRKGVIQPGDNTLEVALMGSCQESFVLPHSSLKDTRGKPFSVTEHKMIKHSSKTPVDLTLTEDTSSGNGPPHQQVHASEVTCTGSSAEGLSAKETVKGIRSIHLISDEEFLPCYVMNRYWDLFIQSEDWVV